MNISLVGLVNVLRKFEVRFMNFPEVMWSFPE